MVALFEELGVAIRGSFRRPRALLFTVAILSTGIGISVATFSVIQGVLLRGLPIEGSDRIVMVSTGTGPDRSSRLSDIELLRKASEAGESAFERVAASVAVNSVVTGVEGPSFGRSGAYVSGDLFPLLGVEPLLGRTIGPSDAEPDAPRISLLSYRFWQSSFGGDPDVIGTELVVNRLPTTIVGVMPPGFGFPVREDFWTVLQPEATEFRIAMAYAIARLAGGRTLSDARSEVAQIARSLDESDPIYRARSHSVTPYAVAGVAPATRRALGVLLVAAIAVLLVACANVANLRLASAAARSQELAVRGALGASRSRLVAMMVAESIAVAVLAAATGLGIAWILVEEAGRALLQGSLLRGYWIDIRLDAAVVAAALVLALGSTLLAGVLPALVAVARGGAAETLRPGIRGVGASTRAFVAFQIGLCFALTVAAGTLTRSAQALLHSDPGLDGEHLVTSWITLFQDRGLEPEERARFYEELVRHLEARPEVARAAVGESPPWGRAAIVESAVGGPERLEAPGDHPLVRVLRIGPGFVATAGLPLLSGREPTREELSSRDRPALVSASFARRRFGSLGQAIGSTVSVRMGERVVPGTIVGVVGDIWMLPWQLDPPVDEQVYLARRIDWEATTAILLRSRGDDRAALRALEEEVESLNRLAATFGPSSFNEDLAGASWEQRRLSQLFLLFGAASVILVAGGLYSVVDLAGRRRTRELGLRLALGAVPAQVRRLVLREGLLHVLTGVAIGGVALALLAPALRQFLVHVELWDPWIVAGGLAVLATTVTLAAAGPARRAGRLDPAETLRAE